MRSRYVPVLQRFPHLRMCSLTNRQCLQAEAQARSIMRGTLSQYASVFKHQVFTGQQCGSTTLLLFLFLLFSLLGRFGVALLGFAYNLKVNLYSEGPLFRPDWGNGTLSGDDSSLKALTAALGISNEHAGR